MEFQEFSGKTVDEAVIAAAIKMETTRDNIEYEVVDKGSIGFLGMGARPAKINARMKEMPKKSIEEVAKEFLQDVFEAMKIQATVQINIHEDMMDVDLSGDEMGILIGKRGQTLDSLQYLLSLVVNKESENYVKVKVDTENYRQRRKETLESLARNIAFKVKRTKRPVSLEPMNPFERRVIHSALQNDKYVTTRSEGEEPYRHVIVSLKK
ncbi:MAG: RNA-binding cell elongation regulator Jag/EloR [Lachnospiraceae bacterium]|nr:RNA-binding cell elongation regulator Jag/EloR [Lachnospiraceae bacterium]